MNNLGFETLLLETTGKGGSDSVVCDCFDCDYNCEECDKAPDSE